MRASDQVGYLLKAVKLKNVFKLDDQLPKNLKEKTNFSRNVFVILKCKAQPVVHEESLHSSYKCWNDKTSHSKHRRIEYGQMQTDTIILSPSLSCIYAALAIICLR